MPSSFLPSEAEAESIAQAGRRFWRGVAVLATTGAVWLVLVEVPTLIHDLQALRQDAPIDYRGTTWFRVLQYWQPMLWGAAAGFGASIWLNLRARGVSAGVWYGAVLVAAVHSHLVFGAWLASVLALVIPLPVLRWVLRPLRLRRGVRSN